TALRGAIHRLRKDNVPAQTIVERELRRQAPAIFGIKRATLLPIGGVGAIDVVPLEGIDVSKQDRGDSAAARAAHSGRTSVAEGEIAGARVVTRVAQIHRVAQIGAKTNRVIAADHCPVICQLEDLLALQQRAIATLRAEVAETSVLHI